MVLVRMKKIFILLTLGWMAILTASAQGSPVEQFNQAQAEALQASAAGNYEQALQHYNTCITLMKANWPTHASLPVLMNNAAMIYGDLGLSLIHI